MSTDELKKVLAGSLLLMKDKTPLLRRVLCSIHVLLLLLLLLLLLKWTKLHEMLGLWWEWLHGLGIHFHCLATLLPTSWSHWLLIINFVIG